jgi:hypothetical protein
MTSTPTPPTSTRDVLVDHSSVLSRTDLRGRAIGTINLALFALAWTNWGLTGIVDTVAVSTIAAAVLCSVACVAGAILVFRRAAAAPDSMDVARGRAVGRRFGAVVAAEFIGLAVIAWILGATGHSPLIPAVICLGVGIHFFPLARLFAVPLYDRTGAALSLVAVAAAVLAPLTGNATLWTLLPGIGAALVLYATCASLLHMCTTADTSPKP